jgi:cell pole-organizing protein PopZ
MTSITQVTNIAAPAADRSVSAPRSASRIRTRPPIDDSVDRIVTTFEKTLGDLTARLAALEGENASLRERLITAEAQSAEKQRASSAALTSQAATITGLTETVSALTARIDTLQRDVGPVIAKHYAPPPPPTRQCPHNRHGLFDGSFYTEVYINGEWKYSHG